MDKRAMACGVVGLWVVLMVSGGVWADGEPIDIGCRLEPMVDDFLLDAMENVDLRLHAPIPRDVAITYDAPWEGNTCCYVTVFQDGDLFRMYYRGSNFDLKTKEHNNQRVCYAESSDGIHWTKPELGLFEYEGSKANNIVWEGVGCHNFSPFVDTRPGCPPEAKYKALASGEDHARLVPFQSPDAIHWTLIQETPVVTEGAFDSQNLGFWDSYRGHYVEFHRGFTDGVRAIMTSVSDDFLQWTKPAWLEYEEGTPKEHLYTNAITAYARAPHIFFGFPKRFVPSRDLHVHPHPGVSDGVFMTSRDGFHWHRWQEALIRPGLQKTRWVNRNNMTAWGILQTKAFLPDTPDELSVYSTEGYYVGPCHLRRFTVRLDGFVSVNAPGTGGRFATKPLVFGDDPEVAGPEAAEHVGIVSDGALRGGQSVRFAHPGVVAVAGTQNLGKEATMAALVKDVPAGYRRLFSAYDGGAVETTAGELWFSFDSDGAIDGTDMAVSFGAFGELLTVPAKALGDWSMEKGDGQAHHLAATWQDGLVTLYFDGKQVAQGGSTGRGELAFRCGDLQFGEDYPPTVTNNEPFLGLADDILVLRRALSAEEMARVAQEGAAAVVGEGDKAGGVLYTFDEDSGARVRNVLASGVGDTALPGPHGRAETELVINYSTSAAGSIRCAILDASGEPIPGYGLGDCDEIYGDHVERAVTWHDSSEVKPFVGQPVRLQFEMKDADLYAIRFR